MWLRVCSNDHAPLTVMPYLIFFFKIRMIFSLVAMTGLEKCCITSESAVAMSLRWATRGPWASCFSNVWIFLPMPTRCKPVYKNFSNSALHTYSIATLILQICSQLGFAFVHFILAGPGGSVGYGGGGWGGGRVMWSCHVSRVTGASNWYWLIVGQGLVSL